MRTPRAFESDPYLREIDVEILDIGEQEGRPYAVLSDTVLYPEGGGQPADHGTLAERAVVDVQRVDAELRHYLDGAAELGAARLSLDWERRYDHMQQHTAQHLLSAVASTRFGWETTAFHLGAYRSDVELDVAFVASGELDALEEAVAEEVRASHGISCRRVEPEQLADRGVRSRGLPAGHTGTVRLVEIPGIDVNTCGGTHLRSTAEIESVKLLGIEPMRGGTRLYWVAGRRVRRLLRDHEGRAAALRSLLDTGDPDIVDTVVVRLERLRHADRQVRSLQKMLGEQIAQRLAAATGGVAEAHIDDIDLPFLQQVARRLAELAPHKAALLTANGPSGRSFVLLAGGKSDVDPGALGPEIAELLEGRGGGRAGMFQGKAGSLTRRPEALALLQREAEVLGG